MIWNDWPIWITLFYAFFRNIIKVNHFCIILLYYYIKSFLFHFPDLCLFHMHFSIKSIDFILLSSLELKAILLIYSVKTLCFLLLDFCCLFSNNFSFLMNSLWGFFVTKETIYVNFIFFWIICFILKLHCF